MDAAAVAVQDGFEPLNTFGLDAADNKQRLVLIRYPKGLDLRFLNGASVNLGAASSSSSGSVSNEGGARSRDRTGSSEETEHAEAEAEVAAFPIPSTGAGQAEELVARFIRGNSGQRSVNDSVRPVVSSRKSKHSSVAVGQAFKEVLVLCKRTVQGPAVASPEGGLSSVSAVLRAAGLTPSYAPVQQVRGLKLPCSLPFGCTTPLKALHAHQKLQDETNALRESARLHERGQTVSSVSSGSSKDSEKKQHKKRKEADSKLDVEVEIANPAAMDDNEGQQHKAKKHKSKHKHKHKHDDA